MAKLLILGATGLVGERVMRLAIADPRVSAVIAPTRRPMATQTRLENPVVNFDQLDSGAPWWRVDAVISALGTTARATPSLFDYERIEVEYPIAVAKLTRDRGAAAFAYVSSVGASPTSRSLYLRRKATAEVRLQAIGFPSLTLIRPAGIVGPRQPARPAERALLGTIRAIGPVLPRRWRVVTGEQVAKALLEAVLVAAPGIRTIPSEAL